jgi:peptide/nickel transport system substrate-binding protein
MKSLALIILLIAGVATTSKETDASETTPRRGGVLNFAISAETPNYDCHAQASFAAIHFLAPFYSTLLQIDLDQYPALRGDLAESWTVAPDMRSYTFKIRPNVTFHDGQPLTSADIKATYDRLRNPPTGVVSARKATFEAISEIETPDPLTVVFKTSKVDTSLLQQFASPWNCVYSAAKLAENPEWPETNVMGTGPFRFVEHVRGSHVTGARNLDYFVQGQPYLAGFRGNFMLQAAAMVNALQGGQVLGEFRGISPAERDRLTQAMGDKIRIEESPWTLNLVSVVNSKKKPFDDVRVRQALSLAIDRWTGSQALSRTSTLRSVGGLIRPGSEFATPEAELVKLPGFGREIKANREQARKLLAEAGASDLTIKLVNRTIAQPYTTAGVFLIDQWRQIGVKVEHVQLETTAYTAALAAGNFDVAVDFSNLFMDEPTLALAKYVSADRSPENYSGAVDRELDQLFDEQRQAIDPAQRAKLLRHFEARALTQAYQAPLLWWHRIVATNDVVQGWRMSPSHTLGQDLARVWLKQ